MLGLYMHRIFGSLKIYRVLNKSKASIILTWHILFTPGPLMRGSDIAPIPYRVKAAAPRRSSLLDLPPEIFEQIIDHLVHIEKAKSLFRHRGVCRTFDKYVLARRVEAVVQHAKLEQSHDISVYDAEMTPWSRGPFYCGHVVPMATPIWRNYWSMAVGEFIPTIIENLIDFGPRPVSSDARRHLRARYFIRLLAQWTEVEQRKVDDTLLAAAAAVGDEEIFLYFVYHVNDVWQADGRYFPNALDAAVAAGQKNMVKTILEYVTNEVKGLSSWRAWESVKKTGSGLLQSLRLAVRFGHTDIAHMIFEILSANKRINDSITPPLRKIEALLQDADVQSG
ncbi:hypothetical protein E8E11_010948 [Didymella keratinophila]|nr:hypothetical protein E8E11_010948 [Didymella keratinophila]